MVSLIVAIGENRVIGAQNKLPWHLPADLKRFKELTLGHAIVMGRKTFDSIGKPLPGRTNIVVTRQTNLQLDGCTVVHSLEAALEAASDDPEIFVIGGAQLFSEALGIAGKIYLTDIKTQVSGGDAFFPEIPEHSWQLIETQTCQPDAKNRYHYEYQTYLRVKKPKSG